MNWRSFKISSEADYGVFSDQARLKRFEEYFLVVEDKRPIFGSICQAERQLSGEMLIAAQNRAMFAMKDQSIFGMTMIGTEVRFYKTTFSTNYLEAILMDKSP